MRRKLKKLISMLTSRVVIIGFLIVLQLVWFVILFLRLTQYATWINITFVGLSLAIELYIINKSGNPSYKILWMLFIGTFPLLGGMMYLLFGDKRPSRRIRRQLHHGRRVIGIRPSVGCSAAALPVRMAETSFYLESSGFPMYQNTKVEYFSLADEAFPQLLEDLRKARHYIFMEYFIVTDGVMWDSIKAVLKEKAAAGVEVRFAYDDLGSVGCLPKNFRKELAAAGIHVLAFNPFRPALSAVMNNRNHRKITVIDGYIAYTGGFNLADEYINAEQRFGYWKDAALRVEGDAAWNFTVMFLNFWNAFRSSETDYDAFRPMPLVPPVSDGIVQPYADSPLDEEPMAETVYLNILAQAQRYVYIYTPYLAVGEEMLDALKNAAKRGVDIRLVLPGIPDKKLVFRLSRSYYLPLLRAGVRIYEYTPGFLHAKCWVSDDVTAVVGSINMDYRSLFLHFECGVLLQKNSQVAVLRDDVRATLPQCREIQVTECRTSLPGTVLDSVLRLLSPLM